MFSTLIDNYINIFLYFLKKNYVENYKNKTYFNGGGGEGREHKKIKNSLFSLVEGEEGGGDKSISFEKRRKETKKVLTNRTWAAVKKFYKWGLYNVKVKI